MINGIGIVQIARFFREPGKAPSYTKPAEICFAQSFTNLPTSSEHSSIKQIQHFFGCYFNEVANNASRLIKEGKELLKQNKPPEEINTELNQILSGLQSIQELAKHDMPSQEKLNEQGLTPKIESLLLQIKSALPSQSSPE